MCTSEENEFNFYFIFSRYDYLEFTDSTGRKRKFDQSVGTEKWPLVCKIRDLIYFSIYNAFVFRIPPC